MLDTSGEIRIELYIFSLPHTHTHTQTHTHTHTHTHIYIYIYIYKCKCLLRTDNLQFYNTNWFKIFREYFIRIQGCFYILIIKKYYNNLKNIFNKSFFSDKNRTRKNNFNLRRILHATEFF